jgi:hypothetical protein
VDDQIDTAWRGAKARLVLAQMRNAKASCCCGGTSYAAVGLTLSELVRDAENFQGRRLLAHCLNVRLRGRMFRTLSKLSGLIPERLAQLDSATFDRLHHSVRGIGVACHDVVSGRPCYFEPVLIAAFV